MSIWMIVLIAAAIGMIVLRDDRIRHSLSIVIAGALLCTAIPLLDSIASTAEPSDSTILQTISSVLIVSSFLGMVITSVGLVYLAYALYKIVSVRRKIGKRVVIVMEDGTVFRGVLQKPDEVLPEGRKVKVFTGGDVIEGKVLTSSPIPKYFLALVSDGSTFLVNTRKIRKILDDE